MDLETTQHKKPDRKSLFQNKYLKINATFVMLMFWKS